MVRAGCVFVAGIHPCLGHESQDLLSPCDEMHASERVFGGMEFEPMLTPMEKSPLPENVPRGGSNLRRCGQRDQALPTELFRPPDWGLNPEPFI